MSGDWAKDGLLGHLAELRDCLLRCVAVLCVLIFALLIPFDGAPFAGVLFERLALPLSRTLAETASPAGGGLISTGVLDPFLVQITTAALSAFLISLPYLLFEAWRFVAPGLYRHEKKLVLPLVVSSTLLFYLGMLFAYFLVFRTVFHFIAAVAPEEIAWTPDILKFFGFAVTMFLAFGVAFETPVAVYLLVRSGIVEADTLRRGRRYVIVGAFVVAAIFTPPDVISQLLLAIPCWLLFELGLFLAPRGAKKDAKKTADAAAAERNEPE
ncbi:MAG: twin-arginine translocase subunit TatC [Gammaproteobacteria bacterium]